MVNQAIHDLETAKKMIGVRSFDAACFYAHQSVEKILKSIYALKDQYIPRTHSLIELSSKLDFFERAFDELSELSSDYIFSRYPDVYQDENGIAPFETYNEEDAKRKVQIAKKIFIDVDKHIKDFKK